MNLAYDHVPEPKENLCDVRSHEILLLRMHPAALFLGRTLLIFIPSMYGRCKMSRIISAPWSWLIVPLIDRPEIN